MLALLIPVFLFLAALAAHAVRRRVGAGEGVREPLILGALATGAWTVLGTELLSLFDLFLRVEVAAWWGLGGVICVAIIIANRGELAGLRRPRLRLDVADVALLLLIVVVVAAAGATAWYSPPNNWDSMTYHLPRQVRWLQQAGVAHFHTHEIRQLQMPPLAEYFGAHLMLLADGDRGANLVQWSAYVLSLIAGALVAREIGAARRVQIIAATLIALIPMAYMQASSPKNDLVLSLWLLSAVWLCLRYWRTPRLPAWLALPVGVSFGLMFMTKGTGLLFAVPVAAVGGIGLLLYQRRSMLAQVPLIFALAAILSVGHYARNWVALGSPMGLGQTAGEQYQNETRTGRVLLSNIVRNVTLHVGTSSDGLNQTVQRAVAGLHTHLIGISASDPRTTYLSEKYKVFRYPYDDDTIAAPVHALLAIIVVLAAPWLPRGGVSRRVWLLFAVALACFLLFCLMLKWQPWHARLHVPIQCLFAILAALLLRGWWARFTLPLTLLAMVGVLLPTALWNYPRPLMGPRSMFTTPRETLYFNKRPDLEEPARAVVERVAALEPRTVALLVAGDEWEYVIERLLMDRMETPPRFVSFRFWPLKGAQPDDTPPDVAIAINVFDAAVPHAPSGVVFKLCERFEPYALYRPQGAAE